jgi:hypothetical protein
MFSNLLKLKVISIASATVNIFDKKQAKKACAEFVLVKPFIATVY